MLDVRSALRRAAEFHTDRPAVRAGDQELTFGEAWGRGLRLANALLSLGIEPGDRVAVLEANSLASTDFFLGTAAANLVRVPLYARNARKSHIHMLQQTECRAVVVSEEFAADVAGLDRELPDLEHVIVRDSGYESWLMSHPDRDPDPAVDLDDLYLIRHSAGTSGVPKGIAFSHGAWMSTERDWTHGLPPIESADLCQHAAPISHGSGYLFVPVWLAGGTSVLEENFDVERVLDTLAARGGYLFVVPTMLARLTETADKVDLDFPDLKAIVVSGAPIRPNTALAARAAFGETLYQMYGQTEAVPVVFMGPQDWFGTPPEGSDPLRAAGRVMPFAEVEIRDEDNLPVGAGVSGEIAVRCDGQMSGIWHEPKLTEERLVDGWVLTGDIGEIDRNGFLYVVDRKDDMIISGGFNIWPAELENAISELEGVREVAVIGVPDERWGESPFAVVVAGQRLEEADVIAACAEKLGSYKKPSGVLIQTEPLPRTPVGKISRPGLRAPYWDAQEARIGGS